MARTIGSWLSGGGAWDSGGDAGGPDRAPNDYPGRRLGLPQSGPGSIAGFGRRLGALFIDWFIAYGLVGLAVGVGLISRDKFLYTQIGPTSIAVVWWLVGVVAVRLFAFTPGQLVMGLKVASVDHRLHVGVGRAAVRGLLVFVVVPALFTDSDLRGFQDRVTNTAVVRR